MLLKDFQFESKAPLETVEKAKVWLIHKKPAFSAEGNFAVFTTAGVERERLGGSCHSGISFSPPVVVSLVATEIAITRFPALGADADEFLRWFLYRSFASAFILNKDDFSFCREYGIIVSSDIPQPILQAIMIISRHFCECRKEAFLKFNELVSKGICEELAYSCCFNTYFSSGEGGFVVTKTGHRAWGLFCFSDLIKFINKDFGNLPFDPSSFYRNYQAVRGVLGIFNTKATDISKEAFYDKNFCSILAEHRRRGGNTEQYRPPNPFIKKGSLPPPPNKMTYDEFFDLLVPYINEKVKEHVYANNTRN